MPRDYRGIAFQLLAGVLLTLPAYARAEEDGPPRGARGIALLSNSSLTELQADAAIREKLKQQVSYRVTGIRRQAALEALGEKYGLPVIRELTELKERGIDLESQVSLNVSELPLGSLLRLILEPVRAESIVQDGVLKVTSQERADEAYCSRIYDVAHLASRDDYADLKTLIMDFVSPEAWSEAGGAGDIQIFRPAGVLIVWQSERGHERVESFLEDLETALHRSPQPVYRSPVRESAERLRQRLQETRCKIDLDDAPLFAELERLAGEHALPLYLDWKEIAEEKVPTDITITEHSAEISLASALALLSERFGLSCVQNADLLIVTSTTRFPEGLENRVYDLRELMQPTAELIWPPKESQKIVDHYDPRHPLFQFGAKVPFERRADFQRGPRAPQWDLPADSVSRLDPPAKVPEPAAKELIETIYATIQPDMWDEVGGPGSLMAYESCLIVRNTPAVQDEIEHLLIELRDLSLKQRLRKAAKTDHPSAELELVVYRLDHIHRRSTAKSSAQDLAKLIPECLAPETWKSAGGTGTIHVTTDSLVVRQTQAVHRQIVKLLYELLLE